MQSVVVDIDDHTPQGGGVGAAPSASGKEGANEEAKKAGEPSGPTAFWADLAEKSQKLLEPVKRASDQLQRQPSWLSTSVASIQGLNARASEAAKKVVSDTTEASVASIQSINARASEAAKKVVGNTAEASIQEQEAAATKVQAVHRGNAARRGLKFLQDQADKVQKKTKKVFNQADFAKPLEDLKHGVEEGAELVRRATAQAFDPLAAKARLASPAFKSTVSNIHQAASVTKLHDMQVRAAARARDETKLLLMVLRGRARQWLKRNEMASAAISVCYLVLIFAQIVMEEPNPNPNPSPNPNPNPNANPTPNPNPNPNPNLRRSCRRVRSSTASSCRSSRGSTWSSWSSSSASTSRTCSSTASSSSAG